MSTMNQERSSDVSSEQYLAKDECKVEHCFFPWTIKVVKDCFTRGKQNSRFFSTVMFSTSGNDETATLWKIELKCHCFRNDIQIYLTRLKSQNASPVFVRFHWDLLDAEGNSEFPGSIHTTAYPGDTFSKRLVETICIIDKSHSYLADGNLRLLCELSVYGRNVEDFISFKAKENVPYEHRVLSEDMMRLLGTECTADLDIKVQGGMTHSHRSILSARSHVFAELLKMNEPKDNYLYRSGLQADVLQALLMYLYCGRIDLYMEHTIPKELYVEAKKHGLLHLQNHLDTVYSNKIARLKSIDVTWNIPSFSILIQRPKTVLYCPAPDRRTLYDDRWCFKLELKSSSDNADIFVIRRQTERSVHVVRFVVKVETLGTITYEGSEILVFSANKAQGLGKFLTKDKLCDLLSFQDTLVLKCSLEILRYFKLDEKNAIKHENINTLTSVAELFTNQMKASLQQLSNDLNDLFSSEMFSDARVQTKTGEFSVHSCIVDARFLTPIKDLEAFLKILDPVLMHSFFQFLYGGNLVIDRARKLRSCAQNCSLRNVAQKFSEFLGHYHSYNGEFKCTDDQRETDLNLTYSHAEGNTSQDRNF